MLVCRSAAVNRISASSQSCIQKEDEDARGERESWPKVKNINNRVNIILHFLPYLSRFVRTLVRWISERDPLSFLSIPNTIWYIGRIELKK